MEYVLNAHGNGRTYIRRRVGSRAAKKWGRLAGLRFDDGWILHVSVRETQPRERIVPVCDDGYSRMLDRAYGREGIVPTSEVGG